MSYSARVLADSVNSRGDRLLTVEATFPRFILAEVNTHRMFSRNSASSRAIPPEKHIERIMEDPFVPEAFHRRVKGMGQGEALATDEQERCRRAWLTARDQAIKQAEALIGSDVSKAHVNRLLEPFMWHTVIISATEWENFFALRCPPGDEVDYEEFPAQPEFQRVALLMREAMRASSRTARDDGEWHLPLVLQPELNDMVAWNSIDLAQISAGRCARVSFDTHENFEEPRQSLARTQQKLEPFGHLSPLEHPARPFSDQEDRCTPPPARARPAPTSRG